MRTLWDRTTLIFAHASPSAVRENDNVGGPSNGRDKSGAGNIQASASVNGHDDDTQMNSDLLAGWTQRLQVLTVVVRQWCLFEHIYLHDTASSRLPF